MPENKLRLAVLSGRLAICRLPKNDQLPDWALTGTFVSITRTAYELSLVCDQANVPIEVQCEKDWRCLQVCGPLDFSLTGILAALLEPLAEAEISVFAVSTFDTDYLLVKEASFETAVAVLSAAGHRINL